MSLDNYSDLRDSITAWTGRSDLSADNYADFTNMFEAFINRTLRVREMETTSTLSPVSGEAALPADYLQWRRVTWEGTPSVELDYVHPSMLLGYYPSSSQGTPAVFTIEGSTLKARPISSTSLTLDYFAKISGLVANSTNWLLTAHPDLYLAGTLYQAYLFCKDPEQAAVFKGTRDQLTDEIQRLNNTSRAPGAIRAFGITP